jgi:hypothetical protein
MNATDLILGGTIVVFGAIGFICISENYFPGQAVGFGVAGIAVWVRTQV